MSRKIFILKAFVVAAMLICPSYTEMPVSTTPVMQNTEIKKDTVKTTDTRTPEEIKRHRDLLEIATAISLVESKNNPNVVSKCGRYVGWLQISSVMVQECKRLGYTNITKNHRKTKEGSMVIFTIMMNQYNPSLTIDKAIKIWNSKCGKRYVRDVKNAYAKIKNGEHELDDLQAYKNV